MRAILDLTSLKQLLSIFSTNITTKDVGSKTHIYVLIPEKSRSVRASLSNKVFDAIKALYQSETPTSRSLKPGSPPATFIGSFVIHIKPSVGSTELLGIKSNQFTEYATKTTANLGGQDAPVISYRRSQDIINSILYGLKNNKAVSIEIYNTFEAYFANITKDPSKIDWHPNIKDTEKNELGKYLGELLIGLYAFLPSTVPQILVQKNFSFGRVSKFIVPQSASFSGIDSVIVGDKVFPISSKAGAGAKASIFSNLLPYMKDLKGNIPKPLKEMIQAANYISKTDDIARSGKKVVYQYGVRYILGIPESQIANPYKVYEDAYRKVPPKNSKELKLVVNAILDQTKDNRILRYMTLAENYSSITAFFCRKIAQDFNEDPKILNIISSVLESKSFYQVNLNSTLWSRGKIQLSIVASGKSSVRIDGGKAAYGDIAAKQGLVNYLMAGGK